jgi:serine/threonine-protein kinase
MRPSRKILAAVVLAAATAGAPASASAAGNPYTAQQVCGGSYTLAQDIPLRSNNGAVLMGNLRLMYSLQTGKSCGVLLKARQIGRPTPTSVSVAKYVRDARNTRWIDDAGSFSYYAGPVYANGTPACVRIGGFMSVPGGREGLFVEPGWTGCR